MTEHTLNDRIKQARNKLGWSQSHLAEKLGVTRNAVSLWETGGSSPSSERLVALARMANVSLAWRLHGTEQFDDVEQVAIGVRPASLLTAESLAKSDGEANGGGRAMIDSSTGERSFAILVFDTSMEPRFREGEMLTVDPDEMVRPGDFVLAVLKDGKEKRPVLGRYQEGPVDEKGRPTIRLAKVNENYRTVEASADRCKILGRVVRHTAIL